MPTYNRRAFVHHAIRYFLLQDYPNKELIIIDDGTDNITDLVPVHEDIRYFRLENKITLGAKLNMACEYARGEIIANWDDDDWYSDKRLSAQVSALQEPGISICGINRLLYYDFRNRRGYQYVYPSNMRVWLLGSSLCYTRTLWKKIGFADINVGMDGLFVWATPPDQVKVMSNNRFSVHMIHAENISPKNTTGGYWQDHSIDDIRHLMDTDWPHYLNDGFYDDSQTLLATKHNSTGTRTTDNKKLKNVFACLVHEREDCIIDLVLNLKYLDPSSAIILYNGGTDTGLFSGKFDYKKYGVRIHPRPVPQKHGYLHQFALDCMSDALEHIPFDTFTIVDSDQLCLRPGYAECLSRYLSGLPRVGMLSNRPEPELHQDTRNLVAAQALRETALWKPFLEDFPGWENKFVHWTYWPGTVFTASAIRDLLNLFRENKKLQQIMQNTRIWATEEVILPTLVSLLGYEIAANPTSYDFVKYRKKHTRNDIDHALSDTGVYWIHPVDRSIGDPVRDFARQHFNNYVTPAEGYPVQKIISNAELIKVISKIEGWLSDSEAELLIRSTITLCKEKPGRHNIVEIGSYHGKSTVLFGILLSQYSPDSKVFAIDPHDGQLGAADTGLKAYPPSFVPFKKNVEKAALTSIVEPIQSRTADVIWSSPISLLFIDGLHDYQHVSSDFTHFKKWLKPGSYVAFHDYADYYPGVKKFVDELLLSGRFSKFGEAGSMIILQKKKVRKAENKK